MVPHDSMYIKSAKTRTESVKLDIVRRQNQVGSFVFVFVFVLIIATTGPKPNDGRSHGQGKQLLQVSAVRELYTLDKKTHRQKEP